MKTSSFILAFLLALVGFTSMPTETKAQRVGVNFSVFQSELSRYGRWVNNPRYGEVWVYDEPGFRPYYSKGYWDYSDYGWAWVSDYEWGWAPFHYGRWEQDPYYGWMWIPGYEWAPAWVSWSESGDYYGWAPLGFGLGINIKIGSVPYDRWVFCSRPYMNSRVFRDHCAPFNKNQIIVRNTTIINNYYNGRDGRYWKGPGRNDVERYAGYPIRSRQIDNDHRFGNKRWDDNNRDYANRDRNDRRDNNRINPRDNNNNRGNLPERRYENRNDNNNDYGNNRNERKDDNPINNDVRRSRNERTREIRDDNNRTNRDQNDNTRRQLPNGGQREFGEQERQRERPETNRVENRRDDNNRANRQQNDNIRRELPNREQRSGEQADRRESNRIENRNNGNNRQTERVDRGNNNGNGQGRDKGKRGRD